MDHANVRTKMVSYAEKRIPLKIIIFFSVPIVIISVSKQQR